MDAFPASHDLLGKSASAYEHLRRAASRGQLRPGRRLSATGLAAAFKISETPVREALLRLATEGFLTWEPSKGHFTKPVTLAEQVDLHELISINLGGCLRHSARDELQALDAVSAEVLAEGAGAPPGVDPTLKLLSDLAMAIAARSGNQVLVSIMSVLLDRTWVVRRLDLEASPDRVAQARQRAAGLVAAVICEDAGTAIAILSQHLSERRRRLPELVEAANLAAAAATYP